MSPRFKIGNRIYLRAPEETEIDLFLTWINNPQNYRYITRTRPLGRAEEQEWLATLHKRKNDVVFCIVDKEEDRPIGNCGLHGLNHPNRSAELGILIGEERFQDRGYGTEAMELLCEYGFNMLNLNRIGLEVYEYNERAYRCYEKVGFQKEGRLREARFYDGRYWDALRYGLLAKEWRERG
ncbi:MAG: GNAT family protein [Planctomycetota bacterium]|nr:GNAT family protein [Planctomycetota bacterium]